MSSLSEQLQRIQGQTESTKNKVKKGRASILFDANVAADIDSDSIYTMGLNGYKELCSYDAQLEQYESSLFSKTAYACRRDLQTVEFNNELNSSIGKFLRHVSAYVLLKPTHKVFEYFVRHFKIHEKNVDMFLDAVLPFHSTNIFLRVLSICAIEGTRWEFLSKAQRNFASIERKVLVTRCCDDMSLVNFLCDSVRNVSDGTHQTKVKVTFTTVVLIEVLERCKNHQERKKSLFTRLLPYITDGIKCRTCFDFQVSGYMIVSSICKCGARLTQNLFAYLISTITVNMNESKLDVSIRCLVCVYQAAKNQQVEIPLPQKPYNKLKNMGETLVKVLKNIVIVENIDISAFISKFLLKLLQNITSVNGNTLRTFQLLHFIIDELPLNNHVQDMTTHIFTVLNENNILNRTEKDTIELKMKIKDLIISISKKYPNLIDNAMENSFKSIMEINNQVQTTKGESDKEPGKAVVNFITDVFSFSKHRPVNNSNTTLFLALEHSLEAVRLEALETLQSIILSLNKSNDNNNDDDDDDDAFEFVHQAINARLRVDESPQVLKQLVHLVQSIEWQWEETHATTFLNALNIALKRLANNKQLLHTRREIFTLLSSNFTEALSDNEKMQSLSLELILNDIPPMSLIEKKWMGGFDGETARVAIKVANDSKHLLFGNTSRTKGKRGKKKKSTKKADSNTDTSLASLISNLQKQMANYVVNDLDAALIQIEGLNLKPSSYEFILEMLNTIDLNGTTVSSSNQDTIPKTIIRLCFQHFNKLVRNGRELYFKAEILKQASNFDLENLKDIRECMNVGIDAFNNCKIQKTASSEVYVIASLLLALWTTSTVNITDNNNNNNNNDINQEMQTLMSKHFDGAALEILLLVSQSLEKYSSDMPSNILNAIQYNCWFLIDLCMKSISDSVSGSRTSKRNMISIDFQLLLPYILVAMHSNSKEVREKAYSIFTTRLVAVGKTIKYGEDDDYRRNDILDFPSVEPADEIVIKSTSMQELILAFKSGKNDVINNSDGVHRCLQHFFGGNTISEDEEETIIQWFIHYAEFFLQRNAKYAVFMLLALQKAPSAKVVRTFSSLIDTLLEQYASKSSDNEQAMEEHVGTITLKYVEECFEACINHFSNDDENEKMDMATIQPFLNILNSNVRSNETYIPQNHALKCITSGFCNLLPDNGAEEIFKILFTMLITNQASISRADIFEGIKNLELGSDILLNYIHDLLEDANNNNGSSKKGKKKRKKKKAEEDDNITTNNTTELPLDWISKATILAEICNVKEDLRKSREIAFCLLNILNVILNSNVDTNNQYSPIEYCKHILMEGVRALLQNSILEISLKTDANKNKNKKKRKKNQQSIETEITEKHAEILVLCVQQTNSSQTRNSGLLLLAHLSKESPEILLNALVPVFTYMGKSATMHDDNFTFHVVQRIVESVVGAVQEVQGKHNVTLRKLLNVFVQALAQINPHRRQRLMFMVVSIMQPGALASMMALLFSRNSSDKEALMNGNMDGDVDMEDNTSSSSNNNNNNTFTTYDKIEFGLGLSHRFSAEEQAMMIARLLNSIVKEKLYEDNTMDDSDDDDDDEEDINVGAGLIDTQNNFKDARAYVKDVLRFLYQHISSKGFLRRLVHAQYKSGNNNRNKNNNNDAASIIDKAFFHSCTNIITFMRRISRKLSDGPNAKEKSFLESLSTDLYSTLAKINAALSTPSFLTITGELLQHSDVLVRKTALSLFIEKIEDIHGDLTEEETVMFLDMLGPIKELLSSTRPKKNEVQDYQIAIYTLDILVDAFGKEYSLRFKDFQSLLCRLLDTDVCQKSVILLNCTHISLAKMCDVFGPSALPILPKLMPSLLKCLDKYFNVTSEMINNFTDSERDLLDTSLKALAIVVGRLPKFCTPYLNKILSFLLTRAEGSVETIEGLGQFAEQLTSVVAANIESRVLLPILYNLFPGLSDSKHKCRLFDMINAHIEVIPNDWMKKNYMQIFKLFLQSFKGHDNLTFEESLSYRQSLLDAFTSLILKLNEKRMRPLFFKIKEFLLDDAHDYDVKRSRKVLLYHLCEKLITKLKSIFIPFLVYVYEPATDEVKEFVNRFKDKGKLKKRKITTDLEWHIQSVKYVLSMFEKCFVYDAAAAAIKGNDDYDKFVNQTRFNVMVAPLTDVVTCCSLDRVATDGDYVDLMNNYLTPCVANFALAAGNDELWKSLHHRLCLHTRNEEPMGRYHTLKTIQECFENVGEEYLIMLPETISYLSELLEDTDTEVENLARGLKALLEKLNGGESLDSYLFG